MQTEPKKIIIIVGTNASGKSSLAVKLAKKFNGEVISADSRQVYRGLDIGSGKVTKEEMDGVPHHLIDIAESKTRYTAADFARDGQKILAEIYSRGKLPIVAGGTGFYIDALLQPELLAAVPPNEELRASLDKKSAKELFSQLQELNAARAQDLKNKGEASLKRRLIRAIEVALTTPKHQEDFPKGKSLDTLWIGIQWDDEKLKERIHERTLQRIEAGMIQEVEKLNAAGLSWKRMEELGLEYKHLADYVRGQTTQEQLVENIDRDDWRYAKRQRTWFKRNTDIHWIDGEKPEQASELAEDFLR